MLAYPKLIQTQLGGHMQFIQLLLCKWNIPFGLVTLKKKLSRFAGVFILLKYYRRIQSQNLINHWSLGSLVTANFFKSFLEANIITIYIVQLRLCYYFENFPSDGNGYFCFQNFPIWNKILSLLLI